MYETQKGRFRFAVAFRIVESEQGLAIHVHGPTADSGDEEVLRFDCFQKEPHYHLAWSYRNDPFIPIHSEDPFAWAVNTLRDEIQDLLRMAAARPMSETEMAALPSTLSAIEHQGRAFANAI